MGAKIRKGRKRTACEAPLVAGFISRRVIYRTPHIRHSQPDCVVPPGSLRSSMSGQRWGGGGPLLGENTPNAERAKRGLCVGGGGGKEGGGANCAQSKRAGPTKLSPTHLDHTRPDGQLRRKREAGQSHSVVSVSRLDQRRLYVVA